MTWEVIRISDIVSIPFRALVYAKEVPIAYDHLQTLATLTATELSDWTIYQY